jgi:hypothetical protein
MSATLSRRQCEVARDDGSSDEERAVTKRIILLSALIAPALMVTAAPGHAGPATPNATGSAVSPIVEHYNGRVFTLTPTNWHGAKDCAVVTRTSVYCFDTAAQMNQFTASAAAYPPPQAADVPPPSSCSGYTKIWNGPNWTNIGLAFHDWGYWQNLSSYTTVPFRVISWFSDGQRGYSKNNCDANINTANNGGGSNKFLPKCAEAKNLGTSWPSYSIKLNSPSGSC